MVELFSCLSQKTIRTFFYLVLILMSIDFGLHAQNTNPPAHIDEIWQAIEAQMEQQNSDTALYFIFPLVQSKCGQDFNCLEKTYSEIQYRFGLKFNLFAAIIVSDELVSVCHKYDEKQHQAHTLYNIF